MTVQGELDKSGQRMEYILCVEGIGWPTDEGDLSQGFDGDVFVVADIDGTLAADLGCNIHEVMQLPTSISSSFDSRTMAITRGTIQFKLAETPGDLLLSTLAPSRTNGIESTLSAALDWGGTEPYITDGSSLDNGDVLWVGRAEAVLLAGKTLVGGAEYRYPGSTRGYLGTIRGRHDTLPQGKEFRWKSGTKVHDFMIRTWDRQVALFMHVPGETVGNCVRIYTGNLRPFRVRPDGTEWTLQVLADTTGRIRHRYRTAPKSFELVHDEFIDASGNPIVNEGGIPLAARGWGQTVADPSPPVPITSLDDLVLGSARRAMKISAASSSTFHWLAAGFAYNYRNRATGGTDGVLAAVLADDTAPQATIDSSGRYEMHTMMNIGGNYLRALWKQDDDSASWVQIVVEASNYDLGQDYASVFDVRTEISFLLDNYHDDKKYNRFTVNNAVRRNPVDVLLIFLTTMNGEFLKFDRVGAASATVIDSGLAMVENEWVGYALHCVESISGNLGDSRIIASNTAGGVITLDRPLTVAGFTVGDEYQIRNTLYDVLPFGWGMGIHNDHIDVDSFESVRDQYLGTEAVSGFAIGDADRIDMWDLLTANLARPYGFLVYVSRSSGKLSCRYVGEVAAQDGVGESYVVISADDILSFGEIETVPEAQLSKIELRVRSTRTASIRPVPRAQKFVKIAGGAGAWYDDGWDYAEQSFSTPGVSSTGLSIPIELVESESSEDSRDQTVMVVNAMFITAEEAGPLVERMIGRLSQESRVRSKCKIRVNNSFFPKIESGQIVIVSDTTRWNPANPFTASRGWSSVVCRVVSDNLSFANPGMELTLQIIGSITAAKIAPSADADGKATAGYGDYFSVHFGADSADFAIDKDTLDWDHFAVADRLELRDATGLINTSGGGPSVFTIASFGSNESSTPAGASDGRINVNETILQTVAAGDYLCFATSSGSNTANMNEYAAYGDDQEYL